MRVFYHTTCDVWSDLIQIGAELQKIGTKSQAAPLKSRISPHQLACGFNVVPQRTWDFIVASERREVIAVIDDDPLGREALDRLVSSWCAVCGNELNLTPSGHYFCANRCCKDGFDVTPKRINQHKAQRA
jgi:hypothetical protein